MAEKTWSWKKCKWTELSNAWCYIYKFPGNTTLLVSYRFSTQNHINRFCESAFCSLELCSDPNNESDPSSEYSPLGLTHVMNQYLGQKFTTWVKINCLNTILTGVLISSNCSRYDFCWNVTRKTSQPFVLRFLTIGPWRWSCDVETKIVFSCN